MRRFATIRLVPELRWRPAQSGAAPLDARLLPLLHAIQKHATLRAAALEVGLSYRAAWGLLGDTGRLLGVSLVELQQGRGARLSEAGEQLLGANERASQRLREDAFALELQVRKPKTARRSRTHLSLVGSHDLLLAAFCNDWAKPEGLIGEVSFRGSIESLQALARNEADIAGFHAVVSDDAGAAGTPGRLLDRRRDTLIRFAEREQGLIVQKGNPCALRSLADVAAQQARFVNRQRGSGTRLLIDRLLKQARIAPAGIRGFDTEEYTHLAVAATVATGQADVGFGLKAAAGRLGLDFVPQLREVYWLAVRSRRLETDAVKRLREGISGEPLRNAMQGLAGYTIEGAGTLVPVPGMLKAE